YTTAADSNEFSTRPITDTEVIILQRFARYSFLTNDQSISEVANWACDTCKEITNDTKSIIVKPIPISVVKNSNIVDFLAYIIVNKQTKEIVITFRGTADLVNDYIANIGSFNLIRYSLKNLQSLISNKDIRVSEGFITAWQRFQSSNLTNTLTS
ncbi:2495_t:CDS:2, partial [Gigaspora margarita]